MKLLCLFLVCLCVTGFAAKLPTGDWDRLYKEIHGDGVYTVDDQNKARRKAQYFADDAKSVDTFAERTDMALDGIIKIAVRNLKRYGFKDEASDISEGWKEHKGELQRIIYSRNYRGTWDIGDFAPLNDFLADVYERVEAALTYDVCYILRITDLKTLLWGIPVIFDPCRYGLTEFTIHFCHDPDKPKHYRGLGPVVAYHTVSITCSLATFGAGVFWICSPIAMLVEFLVDKEIAPWLAPKIYERSCQ